jgi:hypothetical protein
MSPRSGRIGLRLCLAVCALAAAGCEEETRHVASPTKPQASSNAAERLGIAVGQDALEGPRPAPLSKTPGQAGPILGRQTQDVRNAKTELEKGGGQVASTRIVAKDPITLQGNAYVSIIGQSSILSIQHAMDLYRATNGRYPKDYDEFMNEIIKANNIALPVLPPYQNYGYDEKEHKLIIIEYPALKEQPPR